MIAVLNAKFLCSGDVIPIGVAKVAAVYTAKRNVLMLHAIQNPLYTAKSAAT